MKNELKEKIMLKEKIISIGIMTGNSLDAVDTVATEFTEDTIKDLGGFSLDIPLNIADDFRQLKQLIADNNGDIKLITSQKLFNLDKLLEEYTKLIAQSVNKLLEELKLKPSDIDIVGFHGQTCSHCPPSISKDGEVYTLQIGSGQMLANMIEIPVAFDFRSDDIMNGGEGAPLAPVHNQHLTKDLKIKGIFPVIFCNGGNTGNIAIISNDINTNQEIVMGWDTGPFNHFIDYLTRSEKNEACDFDGKYGQKGKVNFELLDKLFNTAVRTQDGKNFITINPPKSSDPAWYKIISELTSPKIAFEDRVRTAEFFSAYIFAYNLSLIPNSLALARHFLVFGGGWRNPIVMQDFKDILKGKSTVLAQHQDIFKKLKIKNPIIEWSDKFGYSGQYMEARIFADIAKCKITNEPFSFFETTGCKSPTVGGIIAYPNGSNTQRWSRAAKGWNL